jgi:choline/glycine/proline betaine transport protein
MLTAGGDTNPPKVQRVFWAVLEGVVAATLLLGGGLQALQTAAITTGLPVAAILLVLCFGLTRVLRGERAAARAGTEPAATAEGRRELAKGGDG